MSPDQGIDRDYVPFPNPDVLLRDEGEGKAVLVNLDTGNAVSLNAMGRFIWDKADGTISVGDIIRKIEERFQAVPEDVAGDVIRLVGILKADGFFGYEMTNHRQ